MSKVDLFSEFPEVSAKMWKQKIQFELQGADYNDTLVWESPEGIKVKPFYHADDVNNVPSFPAKNKKWTIAQAIYVDNATKANLKALDVLERGAASLLFTIPSEEIDIAQLLTGIDLQTTTLYFNFYFLSASYTEQLLDIVGHSTDNIHLNIDPIGHLARSGNWFFSLKNDFEILKEILTQSKNKKLYNTLSIDVALYQNAGATIEQQLAYALAHANEYLNYLQNQELLKKEETITFKVATGSNYFFEIAKLRALRSLWATLAAEYDLKTDCHIITTPTKRNKTLYDYNVNMLRTTTECMSAVLGGANSVCNLPYDIVYHKDNEFGERIARNQLLILQHESYFDKVANPADGSYYIESLTLQLAEKSLALFKDIENGGGFLKKLKDHSIQQKIKKSAEKEQHLFNEKKEMLIGSNVYQNPNDKMKDDMERYPFVKKHSRKTLLVPIIEKRLAEKLEKERLKHE